jgi:hypothetical protein
MINENVFSILNNFAITGNAYVDGLILTSIIPIVMAYFQGLLSFFKICLSQLMEILIKYVRMKFKMKTTGKLLCKIDINSKNELFQVIKNIVFDPKVKSDFTGDNITSLFSDVDDCKDVTYDKYMSYWYNKRYENEKTMSIYKDYTGAGIIDTLNKFGSGEKEQKAFKYENYTIKFTKQFKEYPNMSKSSQKINSFDETILIEILTYTNLNIISDNKTYVNILENFLNNRFCMKDSIFYVYDALIGNHAFINLLSNFLNDGFLDSSTGLLKYGDSSLSNLFGSPVDIERKFSGSKLVVDIKSKNINTKNNLIKEFNIFDNSDNIVSSTMGFKYLYKKYVDPNANFGRLFEKYGFYIKDKEIVFIFKKDKSWHIMIISLGKRLTDTDLKEKYEFIRLQAVNDFREKNVDEESKKLVRIHKRQNYDWVTYVLEKRTMSTIYLPDELMNSIKLEIDKFLTDEKFYKEYQIPYKKGLLFYGPPGTGKTSLVKAIAYNYQMDIYMVNVNDQEVNDETIIEILNGLGGGNKILLFEDIDTAFADKTKLLIESKTNNLKENKKNKYKIGKRHKKSEKREDVLDSADDDSDDYGFQVGDDYRKEKSSKKFLTYSGLLNALDGVLSNQHGVITIMTTNHRNKLGDAFLRPGRIDKQFELKECNSEQIRKMTFSMIIKKISLTEQYSDKNNDKNLIESMKKKYTNEYLDVKINEFVKNLVNKDGWSVVKPCGLQFYLLRNIDNIDNIFKNYQDLLAKN